MQGNGPGSRARKIESSMMDVLRQDEGDVTTGATREEVTRNCEDRWKKSGPEPQEELEQIERNKAGL